MQVVLALKDLAKIMATLNFRTILPLRIFHACEIEYVAQVSYWLQQQKPPRLFGKLH